MFNFKTHSFGALGGTGIRGTVLLLIKICYTGLSHNTSCIALHILNTGTERRRLESQYGLSKTELQQFDARNIYLCYYLKSDIYVGNGASQ